MTIEIRAKKHLGQHFLNSSAICDKIVLAAGSLRGFNVIEIGPGTGNLTKAIIAHHPENLYIIEKDDDLINGLNFAKDACSGFSIIHADCLKIDMGSLSSGPTKIISNLPYNISTVLLMSWIRNYRPFISITVMIQKEVGERLLAPPDCKDYGGLSILAQLVFKIEKNFIVGPEFFSPPPKVDSMVVTLTPLSDAIEIPAEFEVFLRRVFSSRRKTLLNCLKFYPQGRYCLEELGIEPQLRPENLPPQQMYQLFLLLKNRSE